MKKFRHGYCYISVDRQNHDVAPTERNAMQPALHAFPEQPADTAEATSRAGLEQAFALFNQMSSQLSESYSLLEERVTELKGQLALVSAQRMEELAEKERLANRLQSLLDLLPGGVIVIDAHGVVREANPAAWACLASRWWACSGVR